MTNTNTNSFLEKSVEMQSQTIDEASDQAKTTSDDSQTRELNIETDPSQCVHIDGPSSLQKALENESRRNELLEKLLAEKDEMINKSLSHTLELEQQLRKKQQRNLRLRERYERVYAYSSSLSQAYLVAQQGISHLHDQTFTLAEELHRRAITITNLEERIRRFDAILTEVSSCTRYQAAFQAQETCVIGIPQHPDNCEEPPTYSSQENTPCSNISTTSTAKPTRSILKKHSTNDSTLTALVLWAILWICSLFKHTKTRQVYFRKHECYPKPSSLDFRARLKRMTYIEQLALARKSYLVSDKIPDEIEDPEQSTQSTNFEALRRKHQQEEHRGFARNIESMTKMSIGGKE